MARLELSFLGPYQVKLDGAPVTSFEADKVRALLAYLAVESSRPHRREQLAALLWPGWPDASARTNLRNALSNLRQAIGDDTTEPPFLLITREAIQFNPESSYTLDTLELERITKEGNATIDQLQSVVARYRGSFLEGFTLKDCPAFDDWSLAVREQCQSQAATQLSRLAELYEKDKAYEKAIDSARQRLALEPWQEDAHRQLMRLLAASGQRPAALAQFEACKRLLKSELGVDPSVETIRAYESIRDSQLAEPVSSKAHPNNLPAQLTSFIGREKEIAEIKRLFTHTRLLTLSGVGGTGKTRLALEAVSGMVSEFEHGVWLVELARITDPALILQTVTAIFGLREAKDISLDELLQNFLRSKRLLLILDNCEHLIRETALFSDSLLHAAPEIQILTTSREALGLTGETIYLVPSLEIPNPAQLPTPEKLIHFEAVRLFVDRAKAALPAFGLTETNAPAVAQICQRLDGIPLALELAAARVKALSVEHILSRLNDRFRLLTSGSRAAMPRQQTLQATIDWSYSLLSAEERGIFQQLSVFMGGWTLEAVEAICAEQETGSSDLVDILASLVNKSLVIADVMDGEVQRYHMLETIRQYAIGKLIETGEANALHDRHLKYCMRLAENLEARMKTAEQVEAISQADAEIHNFRAALSWALDDSQNPQPLAGLRLANAINPYFDLRGFNIFDWLDKGLMLLQGEEAEQVNVRAKTCLVRGKGKSSIFDTRYFDENQQFSLLRESVQLYRSSGDRAGLGSALCEYGKFLGHFNHIIFLGDLDQARQALNESEAIFRELGDAWGVGEALFGKSQIAAVQDADLGLRLGYCQEAMEIFRNIGDRLKIAEVGLRMNYYFHLQGEYAAARMILDESIAIGQEFNSKAILHVSLWPSIILPFFQGDFQEMEKYALELCEAGHEYRDMIAKQCGLRYTGIAALFQGQRQRARQLFLESLALSQQSNDAGGILMFLIQMAGVANAEDHAQAAARLIGAFEAQNERNFKSLMYFENEQYQRILEMVRSHLDEAIFEAERAEGRLMTLEQAIAYAKEVTG